MYLLQFYMNKRHTTYKTIFSCSIDFNNDEHVSHELIFDNFDCILFKRLIIYTKFLLTQKMKPNIR